jgi:C_GCAxxG_C_C family probable redox protein
MNTISKADQAIKLHDAHFNCAQSVACSFYKEAHIDKELLFRASEAFGLGMGDENGTCGALTGALILAGLKNSDGNISEPATKQSTYELATAMKARFEEKVGSLICHDIKGSGSGVPLCPCSQCIIVGTEVVEEFLYPSDEPATS